VRAQCADCTLMFSPWFTTPQLYHYLVKNSRVVVVVAGFSVVPLLRGTCSCQVPMARPGAPAVVPGRVPQAVLQPHPLYGVWIPSPEEKQWCWRLFQVASQGGMVGSVPAVTGAQGVVFLQGSQLPVAVLREVCIFVVCCVRRTIGCCVLSLCLC